MTVSRPTKIVGMVIPDSGNGFFVDLAQHFQRALTSERYAVVVVSSDGSKKREAAHLQLLSEMDVSGVVFIGAEFNMPIYARLEELGRPVLILDREIPLTKGVDFVMLDNEAGIRLAVTHLVDLGHRHIAHIEGLQRTEPGRVRREAFVQACGRASVRGTCIEGDFSYVAGQRGAQKILGMAPADRPTAIVTGNDLAAIGAIQHFLVAGYRVPEDVSVVGFDDIDIASWIFPALTTVRQDREAIAAVGAQLLSSRMDHEKIYRGGAFASRSKFVSPELIIRDSSGAPGHGPGAEKSFA